MKICWLLLQNLLALNALEVRIPSDLDCSNSAEWNSFRQLANSHARRGWPDSTFGLDEAAAAETTALEAAARSLSETWKHMVCGGSCRTTEDLRWGFVEAWQPICVDSANFDRYLVSHYFRNRNLSYNPPNQREGYCHFGLITALVIRAQFDYAKSVAQAQRNLFLAFVLLGDFFAFDFLSSSGWPVTALVILLNLKITTQRLVLETDLPELQGHSSHPGESGPGRLRELSVWWGTSEALKPTVTRALEVKQRPC